MRITPVHHRVQPILPLFMVPPPPPEEPKPGEPISFCGHLRRLMAIQQRHIMLERMMNIWARITSCLRLGAKERPVGLHAVV